MVVGAIIGIMSTKEKRTKSAPLYEIGRPNGVCAVSGGVIAAGDGFVATLCEIEEEVEDGGVRRVLRRIDFSAESWEGIEHPQGLVFYWRTTMPQPSEKEEPFVDDEVLLNMFERLADDEEAQRQAYRFVLGLILMRRKMLRCVRTEMVDGESIWFMKRKGDPPETEPMGMVDPKLADDQVRELADQLGDVFREDFE